MSENAIELRNVMFAYERTAVLRDVTVAVGMRDFLCLIGPNGGGKTTLLKIALGQLHPSQGEVRVLGGLPEQARNKVGYVPQHFQYDPQFPVRVIDVALMGRLNNRNIWHPFYSEADKEAVCEALRAVEMQDLALRPFSKLSGGQRQRVLIARSLASNPSILLLDEPTANVDTAAENMIYGLLQRLNEKICIVMVTHDLAFVSHVKSVAFVSRNVTRYAQGDFTTEMLLRCFHRKEDT